MKEQDIYGSSRLGLYQPDIIVSSLTDELQDKLRGGSSYELTNHLGNVLATVSDYKVPALNSGLIGYYEPHVVTATDYYPFGMVMPARQYPMPARDGTTGGLTMGTGSGYNAGTTLITSADNSFTVELWVKPTSEHEIDYEAQDGYTGLGGQKFVIDPVYGGSSGTAGMGISVGTNGVSVYEHADGYIPALLVWAGSVTDWTHVAVVYNNGTPSLYINGVFKKTGLTSLKAHIHPGNLVASGVYGTMIGEVDEVRVWKTIRTQDEIVANMNRSVTPQQPDLAAYWPIGNNGDGTTLEDVTGNGNDVTLNSTYGTGSFTASGAPVTTEDAYRYGFNGQEKSTEIDPAGNINTAEFWQYDSRIGRRWNLDPKPTVAISGYSSFNDNPISFSDPLGDTLSNGQLVDALKVASNAVKGAIKDKRGFYDDKAKNTLNSAILDYEKKNQLNLGDFKDFQEAANGYYNGLSTIAMVSQSDYESLDTKIINNKNVSNYMTVSLSVKLIREKELELAGIMKKAKDQAIMTAFAAGLPLSTGAGPKGVFSSGTQEAITKAGYVISQVEGYYVRSASSLSNGVYTKTIQSLAYIGDSNAGNIFKLMRAFEVEARSAGANILQVHGIEIVETKILQVVQKSASSMGYSLEQVGARTVNISKQLH